MAPIYSLKERRPSADGAPSISIAFRGEKIHCIEPDNASSRALAVRLGATLLRQARLPEPFDHVLLDIWGQSREQWRARRSG